MTLRTTNPDTSTRSTPVRVLTWLLRIALAALFLGAGLSKIGGDPAMVDMFATIGAGQWLRYFVGLCEVAGAIGVLIPRLSVLAAGGFALLMTGATIANVTVLDSSPAITLTALVVACLTVWLGRGTAGLRRRPLQPQVS
jgi:uncharacterized membrane protein YphA (DoxX/SURF4 family)